MEGPEGSGEPDVPSIVEVKLESREDALGSGGFREEKCSFGGHSKADVDKDFLCPICIQIMKDSFLTVCGHSFCYMCISTHLSMKQNCPCCGRYLTTNQLFPNFLLNKLLMKVSACQLLANASPAENIRLALTKGDVPAKELDSLLTLLMDKKRKAEQEEAESTTEILLEFLNRSRQFKQKELDEIQKDIQFLKDDIAHVEEKRAKLLQSKEQFARRIRFLLDDPSSQLDGTLSVNPHAGYAASPVRNGQGGAGVPTFAHQRRKEGRIRRVVRSSGRREDTLDESSAPDAQRALVSTDIMAAKKRKLHAQFPDLQDIYLRMRRCGADTKLSKVSENGVVSSDSNPDGARSGLDDFQSILTATTRYSKLQMIAELRHGDLFHTSDVVSSIEFDRDEEYFATAGVSRRIKIFQYETVANELADVHFPNLELTTRSKLSCLSWNKYVKAHIASSDYEGIVMVWDVKTRQSIMEYEEHEKRVWSVDFSKSEPTSLVSGSDDGKVKIWCTRQETSVMNIDMKANICSVKYNPASSNYVALGSADHHVHYYDLRHIREPLYVFHGHRKTVSYVKFISPTELVSASTDGTLRLWDVQKNIPIRTLKGHTNEKNFVGLDVNGEYLACGSETNEVFVYHKAMPKYNALHRFGSSQDVESDDESSHFISAVCWKGDSPTMLAASSQGTIKVLVLAP